MFNANKMKELQSRHQYKKERPWPYIKRLANVFLKLQREREGGETYRLKQIKKKKLKGYQSIMYRLYLEPDSNT